MLQKSRQPRRQPRQRVPLAGKAGREPRRRDLSRFRRRRSPLRRKRCRQRRGHRRHGRGARRQADRQVSAGDRAARQVHFFRRRLPRHLGRLLMERYRLNAGSDPQVYGIGLKELWEIQPKKHRAGLVIHSAGWPPDADTYGGSFLYHMEDNLVSVGFVVGLAYANPYLDPYEEFQRYKTHPDIRGFFAGGKRIAYGARAIAAGGLVSLPKLAFPGGCLVGDEAGFLNASRIKGSHAAIKSGMLAAEAAFGALRSGRSGDELAAYPEAFRASWLHEELHRARNFKPWMSKNLYLGTLMVGIDQVLFRGKAPWTLRHQHADHETLKSKNECEPIQYPKP